MNTNYFMNMYSVSPVLSAPSVVPLSTINHTDALALAIPTMSNMSNNNAVRAITSTAPMHGAHPSGNSSHPSMVPQPAHPNSHMHMTNPSGSGNRSLISSQSHGPGALSQSQPPPAHPQHSQSSQSGGTSSSARSTGNHRNQVQQLSVPCQTPYMCGVCNQGFRKPGGLKKHMRVHLNVLNSNNQRAQPHASDSSETPNPYKCNVCKIEYSNLMSFEQHIQLEHVQPQALKCTQCGCFRPITLTAIKPFRCESCTDPSCGSFESVGTLRYQITKSTSAPISAQQIHIAPSQASSLKNSIKIEMAALLQHGTFSEFFKKPNKPHKCSECNKSYKHQSTLAMHKKTHSGEYKYRCEYCDKEFYLTEYYNRHMRVHTRERPYTCDVCDKSFSQSNTLTQHKRIHTGEKPYECPMCGKNFSVKDYLNKHIRTHTGEKPFVCTVCGKSYTQRSGLRTHQKTHFPEAHIQDDHIEEVQDEESVAEEESSMDGSLTQDNESHHQPHMTVSNHLPPQSSASSHDHHSLQQNHLDQSQMRLNPVTNPMLRS